MKYIATLALGLLMAANAQAQNNDKLVIKPSGRILFDGRCIKLTPTKSFLTAEWQSPMPV